jgi:hypothetical protein
MRTAVTASIALVAIVAHLVPAAAGSAGKCGGGGGDKSATLTCPSGQYVAGIAARGGLFLDEYSIACRKIPASGAPGSLGDYKTGGPGDSNSIDTDTCDKGHAANELWFRSGAVIDRAEKGFCVKRSGDGWGSGDRDSVADISEGGPGGLACFIRCPAGEAIYKLTVKYGGVIDSIRGECRR